MFTGIISERGRVAEVASGDDGSALTIAAPATSASLTVGGSVAVAGVCLTAVEVGGDAFEVDIVAETLARTTLGALRPGDEVNLESPMEASGRFDGHIVQGHVDGVGEVLSVAPEGDGVRVAIAVPDRLARYVVEKGSLCVDGVSLTVAGVEGSIASVALIPHTLEVTTLGRLNPGRMVNLEVDVIAKYVERMVEAWR